MSVWLAQLKSAKLRDAPATKPTKPPQGDEKASSVGFVAYPPDCSPEIAALESVAVAPQAPAANDVASPAPDASGDPDRYCWPHSPAMNTREIDTFTARLSRFTEKGLGYDEGEALADQLVLRDREGDDRRLCLECTHLQGHGRWCCGNWQQAGVALIAQDAQLPVDLVRLLQRCDGYTNAIRLAKEERAKP